MLASALFHEDFRLFPVHRCGAVAQLGARVNGIHEVAGSIPASSTKFSHSANGARQGARDTSELQM